MKNEKVVNVSGKIAIFLLSSIVVILIERVVSNITWWDFYGNFYTYSVRTYNNRTMLSTLALLITFTAQGLALYLFLIGFRQKININKQALLFFLYLISFIGNMIALNYAHFGVVEGKRISNNITIIAPYISDVEKKKLDSRLLQLSDSKDLKKLKKDIDYKAKKFNQNLQ
ncbi:hypothetical protein [Listeria newyorkensis]|uniref:Uncharacterized protein n=1 Tax=Listeria newyorkensis TaxID=1497681 RepID=A0A841Z0P1_9LIST|nr:hypothetical protein [Listeria newyorkensis]MBC1459324.1 hypothetical protein [Listeria newyorkensis]